MSAGARPTERPRATEGARRSLARSRWWRGPRPLAWLLLLGVLARLAMLAAHDEPRGDVVLDVGVARSVAAGEGFGAGFERGFPKLVGDGPAPPQDRADQHPPLWPLAGVPGAWFGAPFGGLQLASWLAGLLLIALVGRVTARLVEPVANAPATLPLFAMAAVGINWLLVDASANGSLYTAQAALVLLLAEALAAPRALTRVLGAGLVSGALLLLNHQCAVLLPVAPLVLLLAAPPGRRVAGLAAGAGAVGVALVVLSCWWLRNAAAFGDPFHSVNPLYFLYRAGVEPALVDEGARTVLRFPHGLTLTLMAKACLGFLKPNALYLLSTGVFVLPGLGAVAVAALPALARVAWRERDRRLLALLLGLGALGAVSALWPATKLRYCVPLVPLLVVLSARALAAGRALPWERAGGWLVGLVWLGALALTLDDVLGDAADARPERWWSLALGGALLLALPLVARHRGSRARRLLEGGSLGAALVYGVMLLGAAPHTAYHSTSVTPDFFGKHVELTRDAEGDELRRLHGLALERGAERVAGPVELLAWPSPALVEVTRGLDRATYERVLGALLDDAAVDHVVLLRADAPEDLRVRGERVLVGDDGRPWFDGRLRAVGASPPEAFREDAGWLFEVVR